MSLSFPFSRPIASPIAVAISWAIRGSSEFDPLSLSPVVYYDPSDMTTLFQDSFGITPVTAAGQPVGRMLDKSGNGYHATQPTAGKRPLLQTDGTYWWLQGDGIDDCMQTGNIDLTGTDKVSVFAGTRNNSTTGNHAICTFSDIAGWASTVGAFGVSRAYVNVSDIRIDSGLKSTTRSILRCPAPIGTPQVLTSQFNYASGAPAASQIAQRVDGATLSGTFSSDPSAGVGPFGTWPLWLLSQGANSGFNNGRLYSLIIVPRLTTAEETANVERWLALKTGVTLPTVTGRYAYITPTTASAPSSGQIIHGDNLLNKLNIHKTDLDGATPAWDTLTTGSRVVFNGVTYTLTTTVQDNGTYYALSVSPSTQQADATYGIGGYV